MKIEAGKMYETENGGIVHILIDNWPGKYPCRGHAEALIDTLYYRRDGTYVSHGGYEDNQVDLIKEHIPQPRMADETKTISLSKAQEFWIAGKKITHAGFDEDYWFHRTEDGLTWDSVGKKGDPEWSLWSNSEWFLYTKPKLRMEDESLLPGWAVGYCSDECGYWWWYDHKPEIPGRDDSCWFSHGDGKGGRIPSNYWPQNIPEGFDFRDSWVEVKR